MGLSSIVQMKRLLSAFIWLLIAIALGFYAVSVDWPTVFQSVVKVPFWVWLSSIVGLVVSHALRAGRLKSEWDTTLKISWPQAWGLIVRHSAWVVMTPMRGGEALYVWALHTQGGVSVTQATWSLVRLRMQDAWVLGTLSLCIFTPVMFWLQLLMASTILVLTVFVLPLAWGSIQGKLRAKKGLSCDNIHAPQIASWFYATSNWVVKTAAIGLPLFYLLPIDTTTALRGAFAGEIASILPLQPPAGAGVYEAGVLFGIQLYAVASWLDVISSALVVHLLILGVTLSSASIAKITGWSHSRLDS